jgi:hypothetical protein
VDSGRLSAEELAEIRARCEVASPPPWSWLCEDLADHPGQTSACACLYGDGERVNPATGDLTVVLVADLDGTTPSGADMDFVQHARHDVPALLAEIDRLRNFIDAPQDVLFADGREPTRNERHLLNLLTWRYVEANELREEVARLQEIVRGPPGRVAAQSELLSKRAEK